MAVVPRCYRPLSERHEVQPRTESPSGNNHSISGSERSLCLTDHLKGRPVRKTTIFPMHYFHAILFISIQSEEMQSSSSAQKRNFTRASSQHIKTSGCVWPNYNKSGIIIGCTALTNAYQVQGKRSDRSMESSVWLVTPPTMSIWDNLFVRLVMSFKRGSLNKKAELETGFLYLLSSSLSSLLKSPNMIFLSSTATLMPLVVCLRSAAGYVIERRKGTLQIKQTYASQVDPSIAYRKRIPDL